MAFNRAKISRDERERLLKLKYRYENRITIAKHGKNLLDAGDYGGALRKFNEYFSIISEIKEIKDFYELRVNHFDSKKELTEMLMISHLFFEMARLYDAVPKFKDEVQKCLNQFVHFTANQPFQVVNSEMCRKYLKKSVFKNHELFRNSYQQIYIQSKKCYIVTFCYGDRHPITEDFRQLKLLLLDSSLGCSLVRYYYLFSSKAVVKYSNNSFFKFLSQYIVKPGLFMFSKIIVPVIIKK